MSTCFTLPGASIVAELRVENDGVFGTGRAEFPVLAFRVNLTLRCPKKEGACLDFRELRCRISPFEQTYVATSLPARMNVRVRSGQELPNQSGFLEIPVDRNRLALMNRLRNGGDVKLRLDFELDADEIVEVGRTQDALAPSIWGFREHHRMHARDDATIPRSQWVEQVLVATEFAKVHIVELPAIPIESCAGMKASLDALQQAVKLEGQGLYNEAVAKCRMALEPFFEMVDKTDSNGAVTKVPVLKASWQTRLGQRTYDWLNSSLTAVKGATNQAHHVSSSSFDQHEAQMLLAVTTALLAYAVKTQPQGTQ